jgi:hypothetical protein
VSSGFMVFVFMPLEWLFGRGQHIG